MKPKVIEARALTKQYGDQRVVDHLSFEVFKGECFGLIGPNGAGKSTVLRMLYGSSQVDSGQLFLLDLDTSIHMRKIKSRIGILPQTDGLDPEFTVLDNLLIFGSFFNISKDLLLKTALSQLRLVGLEEQRDKLVADLTAGLRRRLTFARATLNTPDLIFLDEPSAGLDPLMKDWMQKTISNYKSENKTCVLTTHDMQEAQILCDRIALMDRGKIISIGAPKELIKQYVGEEVIEVTCKPEDFSYYLTKFKNDFDLQVLKSRIRIFLPRLGLGAKILQQIETQSFLFRKANLDDVFLKLTGFELRREDGGYERRN